MVGSDVVGTVLEAVDAAGIAFLLELTGPIVASPDAPAEGHHFLINHSLVLRSVHQQHRAGGRFKLGRAPGADDGSGKGHGALEPEAFRQAPGRSVGDFPDGSQGDDGAGRTAGHHQVGRVNAQLVLVLAQEGDGREKVFHAHLLRILELAGGLEGTAEAFFHLIPFHSQTVVESDHRVPFPVQTVYPVLEEPLVAGTPDEAAAKDVDDGGLGYALEGGFRTLGRAENVQVQFAGVTLSKEIRFLCMDGTEGEDQQKGEQQTSHTLAVHAAVDGNYLTGDIGREV